MMAVIIWFGSSLPKPKTLFSLYIHILFIITYQENTTLSTFKIPKKIRQCGPFIELSDIEVDLHWCALMSLQSIIILSKYMHIFKEMQYH